MQEQTIVELKERLEFGRNKENQMWQSQAPAMLGAASDDNCLRHAMRHACVAGQRESLCSGWNW